MVLKAFPVSVGMKEIDQQQALAHDMEDLGTRW